MYFHKRELQFTSKPDALFAMKFQEILGGQFGEMTVDDLPAPDPLLFATYDGSRGLGKPGTVGGGLVQGVENLATKVKDTLS